MLVFLTQLFAGKRRFAGGISFCRRLSGLFLLPGLKIKLEEDQTVYASRRYIPVIREYLKGGDAK